VVTNPSPSNTTDSYVIRHTEHLLLTSCKPPPSNNIISSIVQKIFGPNHQFATDDLRKTQKFYELILVDTNSVSLTHTFDKYHPVQILYSKCIIKSVLNAQQWKDPFQERKFSITYTPQTFNYVDYKMAWYRTLLLQPNVHSWVFNFHEQCQNNFSVWFYRWWTMFGCTPMVLPMEAREGWDFWSQATLTIEPYMKDV